MWVIQEARAGRRSHHFHFREPGQEAAVQRHQAQGNRRAQHRRGGLEQRQRDPRARRLHGARPSARGSTS
ncbi:hypothetical protein LP419_13300 [Massilia sp. H-1]|nr:hypothetical protein LP419_13300 [Massilia sp. H-1]